MLRFVLELFVLLGATISLVWIWVKYRYMELKLDNIVKYNKFLEEAIVILDRRINERRDNELILSQILMQKGIISLSDLDDAKELVQAAFNKAQAKNPQQLVRTVGFSAVRKEDEDDSPQKKQSYTLH